MSEFDDFDWSNHKGPDPIVPWTKPVLFSITQVENESPYERKRRMLIPLAQACLACSMCDLGLKIAYNGKIGRDPHVLSNMKPHRIMIVTRNPGWTELERREPLVGEAGKILNLEILKNGLKLDEFYISHMVRCYCQEQPSSESIEKCEPFLRMEINLIKPKLVVALGENVFEQLCPTTAFSDSLKKITKSKYNIPVFAMHHPSPLYLRDSSARAEFEGQTRVLCTLVKAIREREKSD